MENEEKDRCRKIDAVYGVTNMYARYMTTILITLVILHVSCSFLIWLHFIISISEKHATYICEPSQSE